MSMSVKQTLAQRSRRHGKGYGITPAKYRRIAERDGYACRLCGDSGVDLFVDHELPRSRGGTDEDSNLQLACRPCNSSKGNRTTEEWRRYQAVCALVENALSAHAAIAGVFSLRLARVLNEIRLTDSTERAAIAAFLGQFRG